MNQNEYPLVKMVNIHKWFGRIHAVKGVNLDIYKGEVVGLVGDNGAGKSTLVKILAGFYKPDKGEIFVEGQPVSFSSPKDARQYGIEEMYQELSLINTMDVVRNFFLGKEITNKFGFLNFKKMEEEVRKSLVEIGLEINNLKTRVDELSGGQRQGLAFTSAYYHKRKLLILDEPTNNLSVKETKKVLDTIKNLKKAGISIIFVTHNLFHVHEAADKIVVLARGQKLGEFKKSEINISELANLISEGKIR